MRIGVCPAQFAVLALCPTTSNSVNAAFAPPARAGATQQPGRGDERRPHDGLAQYGEPNPEILGVYVWPTWNWGNDVQRWHQTH